MRKAAIMYVIQSIRNAGNKTMDFGWFLVCLSLKIGMMGISALYQSGIRLMLRDLQLGDI